MGWLGFEHDLSGSVSPMRPADSKLAAVCLPGTAVRSLRLTFWHPVYVHIKAQHKTAQPIGHARPHHGYCKQDPCNTKPELGSLAPASLYRSVPAPSPVGKSGPTSPEQAQKTPGLLQTFPGHMWQRLGTHAQPLPGPLTL